MCLAVVKECNLKRHYLTKHSVKFDSLTGDARKNKIELVFNFQPNLLFYLRVNQIRFVARYFYSHYFVK